MSIRVVLVDDHAIIRDGIRRGLPENEFEVIAVAGSAEEVCRLFRQQDVQQPDVVVLDTELPDLQGPMLIEEVLRYCPANARIVALMGTPNESQVMPVVRAGVAGVATKTDSLDELAEAMRAAAHGGSYFSPSVAQPLMALLRAGNGNDHQPRNHPDIERLTKRELQTIELVVRGKQNKEIATILHVEASTIRSYRKALMRKLKVNNTAQLINKAHQLHLVQSPPLANATARMLRESAGEDSNS